MLTLPRLGCPWGPFRCFFEHFFPPFPTLPDLFPVPFSILLRGSSVAKLWRWNPLEKRDDKDKSEWGRLTLFRTSQLTTKDLQSTSFVLCIVRRWRIWTLTETVCADSTPRHNTQQPQWAHSEQLLPSQQPSPTEKSLHDKKQTEVILLTVCDDYNVHDDCWL